MLTIAQQLGDDRPGAKIYDFSVPPWAEHDDTYAMRSVPVPVPTAADWHWDAAAQILRQLGEPQNRTEAIAMALAHAVLSIDVREAGNQ